MPWMMKLYFLGLFLSLLSALFSLLDFLGQLMPLHPIEPCVASQWMEPESRNPMDGPPGDLMGDGRTHKAFGSLP